MLGNVESTEFIKLFKEVEAKLAREKPLTRQEQLLLLAGLLLGQSTRKERRYSQT